MSRNNVAIIILIAFGLLVINSSFKKNDVPHQIQELPEANYSEVDKVENPTLEKYDHRTMDAEGYLNTPEEEPFMVDYWMCKTEAEWIKAANYKGKTGKYFCVNFTDAEDNDFITLAYQYSDNIIFVTVPKENKKVYNYYLNKYGDIGNKFIFLRKIHSTIDTLEQSIKRYGHLTPEEIRNLK